MYGNHLDYAMVYALISIFHIYFMSTAPCILTIIFYIARSICCKFGLRLSSFFAIKSFICLENPQNLFNNNNNEKLVLRHKMQM